MLRSAKTRKDQFEEEKEDEEAEKGKGSAFTSIAKVVRRENE